MRLIDADALLKSGFPTIYHTEFGDEVINTNDIRNAPTVTPDKIQAIMSDYLVYRNEPQRPTGEWLEDSGNIACSHCHVIWLYRRTNYCPNCGAKLKGVEE